MANVFYVYEHWRPDKDVCFYVGKGKGSRAHSLKRRSDLHQKIIDKLSKNGMCVEIRLFASGLTEQEALEIEKSRISHYRNLGIDLANMTDGGDGVSGYRHTDEAKAHFSKIFKGRPKNKGTTGMKFSEETRKKMSDAAKGKPKSPEHAAKVGAKHKGKTITAEHRAQISAAKKGKKHTEEYKIEQSKRIKEWWAKRKEANV